MTDLLDEFPRVSLAHRPTPLEPMPALAERLAGPPLRVKRDDCTGLAMGGNKARQLEFYFGDALERRCDTVLVTGAVQSNYVRSTAAAAAKLGLACHVQLEDRVPGRDETYRRTGNVLLDRLFGATIHPFPVGHDEDAADRALEDRAEALRAEGRRPYVIHLSPEHPPLGALGYVEAAGELLDQLRATEASVDTIVVPTGSAATHAGLLVGLAARDTDLRVVGVCVRRPADAQRQRVRRVCRATAELLGRPGLAEPPTVVVTDRTLAPGYGLLNPETAQAVRLAARHEGLLVDPVYTGKALAGMIGMLRDGELAGSEGVVFWHTGGTPALFGYPELADG